MGCLEGHLPIILGGDIKEFAWEVTNRCNLRCKHCYLNDVGNDPPNSLTKEEGFSLLEEMSKEGPKDVMVVFEGGEPLLSPHIYDYIEYASRLGMRPVMTSNGTLINEDVARKLKKAGLVGISISIDGATADVNDEIRGSGTFEKAIEGLRACREVGLHWNIAFVVNKRNLNQVPAIIDLAKRLSRRSPNEPITSPPGVFLFHYIPMGRGARFMPNDELSRDEYLWLLDYLFKRKVQEEGRLWIRPECMPHYWPYLVEEYGVEFDPDFTKDLIRMCQAGIRHCCVTVTGEVTPCPYVRTSGGNVRNGGFLKIWRESELFRRLRDPRSYLSDPCKSCKHLELCGGCRGRAEARFGDCFGRDPSCPFTAR